MFTEILCWEPPLPDGDREFWLKWAEATKWARPAQADIEQDLQHAYDFRHTQLGKILWQWCRAFALQSPDLGWADKEFEPSAVGSFPQNLANIRSYGYIADEPPPDGRTFDPFQMRAWFRGEDNRPCPDNYSAAHSDLEEYLLERIRVPALDRLMIQRVLSTEAINTGMMMGFAPRIRGRKRSPKFRRSKETKALVAAEIMALSIACDVYSYAPSQIRAFLADSQSKGVAWAGALWALLDDAEQRGVRLM